MKRIAALCLLALLLTGCAFGPGTQDWTLRALPGPYEIWRVNSQSVELCRAVSDTAAEHVLGPYISAAGWTEEWIFVQMLPKKDAKTAPIYYAVSVSSGEILGPFETEAQLTRSSGSSVRVWFDDTELAQMARTEEKAHG